MEAYIDYTLELTFDEEDMSWFIRVKELPGCMSCGDTPNEAVDMIYDAMKLWISVALEDGDPIPEPGSVKDLELTDEELTILKRMLESERNVCAVNMGRLNGGTFAVLDGTVEEMRERWITRNELSRSLMAKVDRLCDPRL